jgi:hypothetical protein
MTHAWLELSNRIKFNLRVSIPKEMVEDSFPHIDKPTAEEMNIAIDAALNKTPIPLNIEAKLSRKPTWEMLTDFCTERGLIWEYDDNHRMYIFSVKRFMNETDP